MTRYIFSILTVMLCSISTWAQDTFNPDSPAEPGVYYNLTVTASPTKGGSVSPSGKTQYAAGATVSLSAYANSGYVFTGWKQGENIISTDSYYNYTIPENNSEIIAVFEKEAFNPTNPEDPSVVPLKRTLTLTASPKNSGSFNYNATSSVSEGQEVELVAYPNSNYTFLGWYQGEQEVSVENPYTFSMGENDIALTAKFKFSPANPGNPGANYWNAETGELIIDDFTPGRIMDAVYNVMGGSSDYNKVTSVIVSGVMTASDFGIVDNLSACTMFDFSRTGGYTSIPSYTFYNHEAISHVILPSCIESINYCAFYNCSALSYISCYAVVPPAVESDSFYGITEGAVLNVLSSAIPSYSESEIWKDFTILPLTTDVRSLEVSLPAGSEGKYKNMTLEITNIASGIKQKFVTTDRITYTFNGLVKNTAYNVALFTQQGKLLGEITNVEIKEDDVKVAFESLLSLKDVALTIKTPDGNDVTSSVAITWFDEKNTYLTQGNTLQGQTAGTILGYKMELGQDLGKMYCFPPQQAFTVTEDSNSPVFTLSPIETVTINGVVKEKDGGYMSGATVAISQKLNGVHSKSVIVSTDSKGAFTAQVFNDITTIAVSSSDYVTSTISKTDFNEGTDLGTIELKPITGVKIAVSYTYTTSVASGETAEKQNWYSDYENISYSIYNETAGREITQFSAQNASIVPLEDAAVGDVLRITASSKKNAFTPVTVTTAVLDDNTSSAEFDIKELGGISAGYTATENASVVGILYNAKGELVKKYNYSASALSISNLADGNYTLITMGASDFFNSILKLSQLAAAGLVENTDYVRNDITVASGTIISVSNETIPEFDESKLYYTGTNTSFTVNKSSIVAGNYLTLKANIDFKSAYAASVSNVRLVVDLPESCSFVDNSLMVGSKVASYMLDGGTLTAQLDKYSDQVRFCVIPTIGGTYQPNAFVVFNLNGKEVRQPIGSAHFTVSDLSISVPSLVAKTTIPVSGTAIGKSTVEIYDNDVLIGETTATAGGSWTATCELVEPYNLSTHSIYAKITTPTGLLLQSETHECQYDMNAIQVSKVTMYHFNPEVNGWKGHTYESVFDFQNPSSTPNKWIVYYPKKVFTYTIDFTNNSPELVSNVILYVHTADGKKRPYPATYDANKDLWVVNCDLGSRSDQCYPVNVSVDFDAVTEKVVDTREFINISDEYTKISEDYLSNVNEFDIAMEADSDSDIDDINNTNHNDWAETLESLISELDSNSEEITEENTSYNYFNSLSDEALNEYLTQIDEINYTEEVKNLEVAMDSVLQIMSGNLSEDVILEDGTTISLKTCDGLTSESLINQGFTELSSIGEKGLYLLITSEQSELVDFDNNRYSIIKYRTELSSIANYSLSRNYKLNTSNEVIDYVDAFNEIMDKINGLYQPIAHAWEETNDKLINFVEKLKVPYVKHSMDFGRKKAIYNSKSAKLNRLKEELKALNSLSLDYQLKLGEVQSYQKEVKEAKRLMNAAGRLKAISGAAYKAIKPLPGFFAKRIPLVKYADAIYTFLSIARKYQQLYLTIPNPCKDDQLNADNLRNECVQEAWAVEAVAAMKLGTSAILDLATFGALASSAGTGGTSILAAAGIAAVNIIANITLDYAFNKQVDKSINRIRNKRNELECLKNCNEPGMQPCPDEDGEDGGDGGNNGGNDNDGGDHKSGQDDDDVQIDPSGFVYEAVESNRLQGVTATCFYKETVEDMYGDLHEQVVLWNAAEYAQENPLFTDENGMYRWDVPQGLWQVKFEKEGYQTTYSEWLPVPPPQLEVNVGMTQLAKPEVVAVRGYEDGIEIDFSKFMIAETLNTELITVTRGEEAIAGTIELLNDENALASKVKYVFSTPLTNGDKIVLTVNKKVKSYADIMMESNFSQEFDIATKPAITVPEVIEVVYGKTAELTMQLTPAKAAAGKKITIQNSTSIIASVNATEVEVDSEGKATITVSGELVGTAMLTFNVPTDNLTASVEVKVIRPEERTVNRTYDLQTGWNWISVNVQDENTEDLPAMLEPIKTSVTTITDGSSALSYDAQTGFEGELSSLVPEKSYMVKMNANATLSLTGKVDDTTISLNQGWNSIGYTPQGSQSVTDALNGVVAEVGDVIMGRDAFATYNGNAWVGSLEQMHPGLGYMYYSQSVKSFNYTQTAEDTSTPAAVTAPTYENWSYNPYKYADNMAVIATLHDASGNVIEPANCVVAAFAGDECRGLVNGSNNIVFLTIHGETKGEEISFRIVDKTNGKQYAAKSSTLFGDAILGSATEPYVIECSELSGIDDAEYLYGTLIYPNPVAERLFIKAPANTIKIAIHSASGELMISKEINTSEGIDVSALSDGVYVITTECNGMKSTHKFLKDSRSGK